MVHPSAPRLARPTPIRRPSLHRERERARVHVELRPREAAIGQDFYMDASQVRGELDRVDGRWRSLKRGASALDAADPLRIEFMAAWRDWRSFYEAAYDDWLAWSTNVDEARRWDETGDAWRARLEERGAEVVNPTGPDTVSRPSLGLPSAGQVLVGLGLVAGIAYLVTR